MLQRPGFTSIIIQVPAGATHLFVTAHDSFFSENADADVDYGLEITVVPEPTTALLLATGFAGLAVRRRGLG